VIPSHGAGALFERAVILPVSEAGGQNVGDDEAGGVIAGDEDAELLVRRGPGEAHQPEAPRRRRGMPRGKAFRLAAVRLAPRAPGLLQNIIIVTLK